VTHDSGIDLLLAPARPEEADMVNAERLGNVLRILREMYDYVIVDLERPLNDLTLSVLELADELVVVMTADLASLKNVRLVMETLHRIGFGTDRLRLVLNRSNAFTGVSIEAAEGALKRRFDQRITNEYRYAIAAENTGQPVSFSKPDSPLARQIAELARSIVGETNIAEAPAAVAGRRRGVMSRG
jgi:pilus assembly protein CpaE